MDLPPRHASHPVVDTQTAAFLDDPNRFLMRDGARLAMAQGAYCLEIFDHALVRAAFRDRRFAPRNPQVFIDQGITSGPIMDYLLKGNIALTWPETHARMRPVLVKGFVPRRIEAALPMIRGIANELIDDMLAAGPGCNFVTQFAHHLSIRTIARFIGVPAEDVGIFDHATIDLRLLGQVPIAPGVPRLERALSIVHDYSRDLVQRRRRRPEQDFISDLLAAQDEEAVMSDDEIAWNVAGILLAGHDTTRYQISSCVRGMLQAGLWEEVAAAPALIPGVINEAMRLWPATPRQPKLVQEDLDWGGESFAAGEVVVLHMTGAGRDPAVFAEPDRMDPGRGEPLFDIGFGHGFHYCLGFAVAKAEMQEALALLTARLTDVALDGKVEMKPTGVIAGPEVVPMRYRSRG